MRIAVDLRALQLGSEYRGIGAYLVNLLRRFPLAEGDHEWVFVRYTGGDPAAAISREAQRCEEIVVDRDEITGKLSAVRHHWREATTSTFGDADDRALDLFWQPDFLQGVPDIDHVPTVVTMYDLIPMVLPDAYLPGAWDRWTNTVGLRNKLGYLISGGAWKHKYRRCAQAVAGAEHVLSISEWTSRDLQRILGLDPAAITTVPLGTPDELPGATGERDADPSVAQLIGRQFLLFIGGVDHRRRLADLVVAFEQLRDRGHDLDLVLVGRDLENLHEVHHADTRRALLDSPHRGRIHNLGFVNEPVKHWLYANAFAFVFPSVYEGFGLPLLEAMVNRCPVISYRNSSLTEVGGDAAILLDPGGPDQMTDAVEGLLLAPDRRRTLIEAGVAQAARYSWDRCAADTLAALERVGRR